MLNRIKALCNGVVIEYQSRGMDMYAVLSIGVRNNNLHTSIHIVLIPPTIYIFPTKSCNTTFFTWLWPVQNCKSPVAGEKP